jgi:hypothetical protein
MFPRMHSPRYDVPFMGASRPPLTFVSPCEHLRVQRAREYPKRPEDHESRSFIVRDEFHQLLAWWDSGATEPVVVTGPAGSGKTLLLRMLASEVARRLGNTAAIRTSLPYPQEAVSALPLAGRALLIHDRDGSIPRNVERVERIRALQPRVGVALATRSQPHLWPRHWRRVVVEPLTQEESVRLLEARVGRAGLGPGDHEQVRRLIDAAEGSPRTLLWVGNEAGLTSVDKALSKLQAQRIERVFPSDTLFPTADLFPGGAAAAEQDLDVRVCAVSDALIERLASEPQLMYHLRPRQFEELMADLFERQGFDVELTKQTRDGGVDLYVVHHTPAGRRLTLVDAKRNAGDRPVGVGVVRQLYGVVEAKRASAGLVATTSFFSPEAQRFQRDVPFRLELMDYLDLQSMLRSAAGA